MVSNNPVKSLNHLLQKPDCRLVQNQEVAQNDLKSVFSCSITSFKMKNTCEHIMYVYYLHLNASIAYLNILNDQATE